MKELRAEVAIAAPSHAIWEILTDFAAYPEWNPFVQRIVGEAQAGAQLRVHIVPPGGPGMTFRPTVIVAEPDRQLRWLGRLVLPGLFDGEHSFTLEPLGPGCTRLTQRERFTGILVPLLAGMLGNTLRRFEQMNEAVKQRAEQRVSLQGEAAVPDIHLR